MSNKAHIDFIDLTDFYNSDDFTDEEIKALIGKPLSESEVKKMVDMDDFWDGVLDDAVYHIEPIICEFYPIEEAVEYLRVKLPTEYFNKIVLANLILEEKLELVVSFEEEIDLANAWLKSAYELKENPFFRGDWGFEYKTDSHVFFHNPLSAFKLVSPCEGIIENIVSKVVANYPRDSGINTKYDVLLYREGKYWKAVHCTFLNDEENRVYNDPSCFRDCATWGISAGSLERYCDTKNNISKSENSKKANQTQHGDKYALYEQIKPLWREKRHLIDSGELSRKKFAMKVLDSPLNHGLNGSKIMCGENSWRTITKLIKEWESEEN